MTKQKKERPPEATNHFFLDSGAHSLYTKEVIAKKHSEGYRFYETPEFWSYVDRYCEFVKANTKGIDNYANVDVIFNPELSWEVLKYIENEHGLNPVPVIHYNTPLEWIDKHLDAGYEYLGIGGLGQEVMKYHYFQWADKVFERLCPASNDFKPIVKTHGFAITTWSILRRYPWFSVDSASWTKAGGFGIVYVPRPSNGTFSFDKQPFNIGMSFDSPSKKNRGRHIFSISTAERSYINRWLEKIGVPVGSVYTDDDAAFGLCEPEDVGKMNEWGVVSHHSARKIANLRYYEALAASMPEWPWSFKVVPKKGLF